VYNRARNELGFKGENPASGIKAFKEHARERFLDMDELPRFFQALAEENAAIRDFILTCLLTGARKSNCQQMQCSEVKWQRACWEIGPAKSKSGRLMTVPLVPLML
jgi:integrase